MTFVDGVPNDGIIQRAVTSVLLFITIIFDVMAFLGMIFCMICLAFNFFLRGRK